MPLSLVAEAPPLRQDGETLRVGRTRVTLETLVWAYREGATPEAIKDQFPTLELADIYDVIAYCLRHPAEVNEYLERQEIRGREAEALVTERFPAQPTRAQLLARLKT